MHTQESRYFRAGSDDFRHVRDRCAHFVEAFNAIPVDAPGKQRVLAWNNIVDPAGFKAARQGAELVTAEFSFKDPAIAPSAPLVKPPVRIDYGLRLKVAGSAFINTGCTILDTPVADVWIGEHVNIGPNVTIVSVDHPHSVTAQGKRLSLGKPVTIEDCAWICAGVQILPGVHIGSRSIIGANSVVHCDIPADVIAVENPARVIRKLSSAIIQEPPNTIRSLEMALRCDSGTSEGEQAAEVAAAIAKWRKQREEAQGPVSYNTVREKDKKKQAVV